MCFPRACLPKRHDHAIEPAEDILNHGLSQLRIGKCLIGRHVQHIVEQVITSVDSWPNQGDVLDVLRSISLGALYLALLSVLCHLRGKERSHANHHYQL